MLLASGLEENCHIKAMIGHEGIPWWAEFQEKDGKPFATLHRVPGPVALVDGTADACCCMMSRMPLNAWLCLPMLKATMALRLEGRSLSFEWQGQRVALPIPEGEKACSALHLWFERLKSLS
ncbi:hypothetical protein GC177_01160 [bacterium]|nr:hypothetical protein [bacterium]